MDSVEESRRALEAPQAKTAALRAAAEQADRTPRVNYTGDADGEDSAYRENYDDGHAGAAADGCAGPNAFVRQATNATILFWAVEIARLPNSRKMKMKPRCGACVLGPTWVKSVWGTR